MKTPDFWYRPPGLASTALAPFGWGWAAAAGLLRVVARPQAMVVPVICVGNLVAGGAGKTPVALDLLQRLRARDIAAHALTRGHGGRLKGPLLVDLARHTPAEVGDEPLLLAAAAPTWVARDRASGAREAAAEGAKLLVLDDGFQHHRLAKDLSLVVVDGAVGFGNGQVMPAGPLRERVSTGLARADVLVMLGEDREKIGDFARQQGMPVLRARIVGTMPADLQKGARVIAFAGLGRPEKFFRTCREMGLDLVATHAFPDHHPYGEREMARLLASATAQRARAVTTEKDLVRVPPAARARVTAIPARVHWTDEAMLERLLADTVDHA